MAELRGGGSDHIIAGGKNGVLWHRVVVTVYFAVKVETPNPASLNNVTSQGQRPSFT